MLENTFCHIEGISKDTEQKIWNKNILSWQDFLNSSHNIDFLPVNKIQKIRNELLLSIEELNNKNLSYFKNKLDEKEYYRLINCSKVAYLDIETTGLSRWTDDITVIGIFDGEQVFTYINGINLEKAIDKIKEFDIIVTFNGKQFDIPFIEHKFNTKFDIIHLDLRYMLKEFDLKGGLKKIEIELGISRDDEIAQIDGLKAVKLWKKYLKEGCKKSLDTLIKYNEEDIKNLSFLLDYYTKKKFFLPNILESN